MPTRLPCFQAAEAGISEAMFRLGLIFVTGRAASPGQDEKRPVAAHAIDETNDAPPNVTSLDTSNVEPDLKKARELFREACTLGHAASFYHLGLLHLSHPLKREAKNKKNVWKAAKRFQQAIDAVSLHCPVVQRYAFFYTLLYSAGACWSFLPAGSSASKAGRS